MNVDQSDFVCEIKEEDSRRQRKKKCFEEITVFKEEHFLKGFSPSHSGGDKKEAEKESQKNSRRQSVVASQIERMHKDITLLRFQRTFL